jgi:hypothetical protein
MERPEEQTISQQVAARQGARQGGRRKPRYFLQKGEIDQSSSKAYKSPILEIAEHTFNTGENKFTLQFTLLQKIVVNHLQWTLATEGYLVAETVRTGKQQIIALPPRVDPNAADKADLEIIQGENIKAVGKRRQKLEESLKKGYAVVYNQCSQEVHNKLKSVDNWDRIQQEQSLHELFTKIKKICVGFEDHKQAEFNLVQSLKTLFLYTQSKKETVEEYG